MEIGYKREECGRIAALLTGYVMRVGGKTTELELMDWYIIP